MSEKPELYPLILAVGWVATVSKPDDHKTMEDFKQDVERAYYEFKVLTERIPPTF